MTIDKLSNAIIPQYIQDERKDYPHGNAPGQNYAGNPLVLQDRTGDRARGLLDRKARAQGNDAVVTLSGHSIDTPQVGAAYVSPVYFAHSNTPIHGADPYFSRVHEAYTATERKDYKGIYVDTLA
ncbi:MAG: hypothetical protein M0024_14755 [Nitrospiraceae bacterium]|nr:hypothetical protein [Nitrospiraceae bacterium]